MNVAVEIAGRKALPVWTIPYVTGRYVSPDRLLEMLAKPDCDEGRYSGFPNAFKLDETGNPRILPPSQWSEAVGQISKLENDLDKRNLPSLGDRQQWCKESIELIMPYRAYFWLDEFETFFEKYRRRFVSENPEICLYPLMPIEHEEHFKTTEKAIIKQEASTEYYQSKKVSRGTKSEWNISDLIDKPLTELINGAKAFEEGLMQTNSFDYSWQLNAWRTDLKTALRQNEIIPEKRSQAKNRIEELKKWANERPPYENGVPELIYGEPELTYTDSISFHQAKVLFGRDASDEEFALHVFDGRIGVYEDGRKHEQLKQVFNIKEWLLCNGKLECFSGKAEPIDSVFDKFRFSKLELSTFKPDIQYIHFYKTKEEITKHLGDSAKAERFLLNKLEDGKVYAYHPFFGRVLPELSLNGERWKKCFIPDWKLEELKKDLPEVVEAPNLNEDETKVSVQPNEMSDLIDSETKPDELGNSDNENPNEYRRNLEISIEDLLTKPVSELLELMRSKPERKATLVAVADSEDESMQLLLDLEGIEFLKKKLEKELIRVKAASYQFEESRKADIQLISSKIAEIADWLDNYRATGNLAGIKPQVDSEVNDSSVNKTYVVTQTESVPRVDNCIDAKLAALFDDVTVENLAKMFTTSNVETKSLSKWKAWQNNAKENGLIEARQGHGKFNPYKAGLWFLTKKIQGWDTARLYRTLANNLPARSLDDKYLLTGEYD